jgi:hypothetical protein
MLETGGFQHLLVLVLLVGKTEQDVALHGVIANPRV